VPGVYVVAETIHLPLDVEIDLLVPDVDGRGGDDELGAKALAFDAHPLELGLDAVQGGKERELKNREKILELEIDWASRSPGARRKRNVRRLELMIRRYPDQWNWLGFRSNGGRPIATEKPSGLSSQVNNTVPPLN